LNEKFNDKSSQNKFKINHLGIKQVVGVNVFEFMVESNTTSHN